MKVYLIKTVSVATSENKNFAGQKSIRIIGKGDRCISHTGSHAEAIYNVYDFTNFEAKPYGYSRKCDATRNWSYRNPENSKFWKSTAEIIEIEC